MITLSSTVLAFAVSLAAGPALAQATYLSCDIRHGHNDGAGPHERQTAIYRLIHTGQEIKDWHAWSVRNRAWVSDIYLCGTARPTPSIGRCSSSEHSYDFHLMYDDFRNSVSINRITGELLGILRPDSGPATVLDGQCRRTTDPELTPVPSPIL